MHYVSYLALQVLVNACGDAFCVLTGMGWVWSTHVEVYSVSSHMGGFGQYMLRCILCPRKHGKGLYDTS
jgi:hypothetical protein